MRRSALSGVLFTIGGIALLAWMLVRVGVAEIAADVRQVGWMLLAIVAIGGLRFLLRAVAWRLCLEPPHALSLGDAFAAVVCGDTIGNLTPLGPLVGEPAKAAFVRGRVALGPAVTALAIENVLYTLSAAAMIASGMVALLVSFQPPSAVRGVGEIAVGGNAGAVRPRPDHAVAAARPDQPGPGTCAAASPSCRANAGNRNAHLHVRVTPSGGAARARRGRDGIPRARGRGNLSDALDPATAALLHCSPRSSSKRRTGSSRWCSSSSHCASAWTRRRRRTYPKCLGLGPGRDCRWRSSASCGCCSGPWPAACFSSAKVCCTGPLKFLRIKQKGAEPHAWMGTVHAASLDRRAVFLTGLAFRQ